MSILSKWLGKYQETNFKAGGLEAPRLSMSEENMCSKTPKFVAPKKLDFRDMCLLTDDQGQTPQCAGYATAGHIEVQNWKRLNYPEQLNASKIYFEAKKLDKNNNAGTSLDSAGQAAINLGLISGKVKLINKNIDNIKFNIHSHLTCVGGFMITNEWNFINKKTGMIADFGIKANTLGGHAVLCCGYDDKGVYIQNSWSRTWGHFGFAVIPWAKVNIQFMYGTVIVT